MAGFIMATQMTGCIYLEDYGGVSNRIEQQRGTIQSKCTNDKQTYFVLHFADSGLRRRGRNGLLSEDM